VISRLIPAGLSIAAAAWALDWLSHAMASADILAAFLQTLT
jgi:hypothetical protein